MAIQLLTLISELGHFFNFAAQPNKIASVFPKSKMKTPIKQFLFLTFS